MKTEVDDWLTDLPPLDGDDDEPASGDEVTDDLLPEPEHASSLDDSVIDDLDVGIGAEITDDEPEATSNVSKGLRPAVVDDERWEADVGEPELDLIEDAPTSEADGEPPVESDGDFGDHEDLPDSEDDAGEEGTTDPIEHSLDEELPAMDADDEGDFEDTLLLEAGEVDRDLETLRWADVAWSERPSLHRSFAWAVEDPESLALLASSTARELIVAVARGGEVWVSRDDGRTVHRAGAGVRNGTAVGDDARELFLALAPIAGALWIGNRSGQLAVSDDLGASFRSCAVGRSIVALAAREDGSVVALSRGESAMELLTSSDGLTWFAQRAIGDIAALARRTRAPWMTCRGASVAVGDELGAIVSRDGRHFTRIPGTAEGVAGVFAGADPKAPLIIAGSFGDDDEVHLVRVAHDGVPEIVAELGARSPVLGLSWLDQPGAVQVLLSGGTLVWGPSPAAPLAK
jgi:hypothetical protein